MGAHYDLMTACRDAVASAIANVGWGGVTPLVVVQKTPQFDKERHTLPFVSITGEDGVRTSALALGNHAWLEFPINVTLCVAGRKLLPDPVAMQRIDNAREAIRLALTRRIVGDQQFAGVTYDSAPWFDTGDLARLFDLSKQSFKYRKSGLRVVDGV
jgi:hypothetical protein